MTRSEDTVGKTLRVCRYHALSNAATVGCCLFVQVRNLCLQHRRMQQVSRVKSLPGLESHIHREGLIVC